MAATTVLEALEQARKLISERKHWTQRTYARTAYGRPLDNPRDWRACKWCLDGALIKVTNETGPYNAIWDILNRLTGPYVTPIGYNDAHTHAEVIALLDRAIEAERAKVAA